MDSARIDGISTFCLWTRHLHVLLSNVNPDYQRALQRNFQDKMGASTNLGPITTSQPFVESCEAESDTVYKIHTTPDGYYWLQGAPLESSCFPSGYAAASEQYYSPASCPSGYTPACQSSNAIGTVTETVRTCCPT